MLENGKYRAKATEWALGKASTGTPQVGIAFDLLDHPGQSITYFGSLTDAALEYTVKALRACGWQGCDLADLTGLDANEVSLVVEQETYNGKTVAKVKWVNSMGGLAMATALDGNDLTAFAAAMKGKILAIDPSGAKKAAARKPAPQQRREEPPPPTDGDQMPF